MEGSDVVGFELDLINGRLVLHIPGHPAMIAFGLDSPVFAPKEQRRQAKIIRDGHWVPIFGIRGLASCKNPGSEPSPTPSESSSKDAADIESNVTGAVLDDAYVVNMEAKNRRTTKTVGRQRGTTLEVDRIMTRAALSFNFGGFSFASRPKGASSCDSYFSF